MLRMDGVLAVALLAVGSLVSSAQTAKQSSTAGSQSVAQRAADLAENGRCSEALPLLKKSIRQVTEDRKSVV